MDCQDLEDNGCLNQISEIFDTEEKAHRLLRKIRFPRAHTPTFANTASIFWENVCYEIQAGKIPGGPQSLIKAALEAYPHNEILKECAGVPAAKSNISTEPCMIIGVTGVDDPFILCDRAEQLAGEIGIEDVNILLRRGDATILRLTGATDRQAEQLRQAIEAAFASLNAQAQFSRENFTDYLLTSLIMVGPNRTRIEATDVPASTTIENLVKPIQDARDEKTGEPVWPMDKQGGMKPANVIQIREDGNYPLNIKESLHANGIRDNAVLQIVPENTAGSHDSIIPILNVEGPDGARIQLIDIPVDTPIKEIARAIIAEYDKNIWPSDKNSLPRPAVVDHVKPDGSAERLNPNATVAESNLQDGDTLNVFPEATAGSVNPMIREEALARVCKQVLAYAKAHPSFTVRANGTHIPTEYLFNFQVPSFGQSKAGQDPYSLDQHEVFLLLPVDFPMKAPAAFWRAPIFHPNIDPKDGEVCLGVLKEKYKPAMNFGDLCQLLVDLAGYRNYEIREGYNKAAAEWVITSEGQAAIQRIGGRSLMAWLINLAEQDEPPLLGIKRL